MWGAGGEVDDVDKVILKRSIMSCSLEVLTGAGGSGRANAVQVVEGGIDEVTVLPVLTNAKFSAVPVE